MKNSKFAILSENLIIPLERSKNVIRDIKFIRKDLESLRNFLDENGIPSKGISTDISFAIDTLFKFEESLDQARLINLLEQILGLHKVLLELEVHEKKGKPFQSDLPI